MVVRSAASRHRLLAAAKALGALRFVAASMVFGYGSGDWGGKVLTEADPFASRGHGRLGVDLAALRVNEDPVVRGRGRGIHRPRSRRSRIRVKVTGCRHASGPAR